MNLIGRTGRRSLGHYNQHRTVAPYLGSFLIWLLTGRSYAPGNRHVIKTDYTDGGQNANHCDFILSNDDCLKIVDNVRQLFPYTEVQDGGHGDYTHYMVIVFSNNKSAIVKIEWNHRDKQDDMNLTVRIFNFVPDVNQIDMDQIIILFQHLGLN